MSHLSAIYTLYFALLILSFNGLFAKILPADAITITQLRSVIAALAFCLFYVFCRKLPLLRSRGCWLGVYSLGALMGMHWITLFHAMKVSTVAIGILSFFSFPVITVVLEPWFSRQVLRWKDLLAAFVVVLGVLVMVWPDILTYASSGQAQDHGVGGDYLAGATWGLISALLMSLRNLIQKHHFAHVPSIDLMFHQVVAISLLALPFIDLSAVQSFAAVEWGQFLLLGVVTTAGGHTLIVVSLKVLPAKTVAMVACAQPVVTVSLAWLFLAERPEFYVIAGGALILSVALYESISQARAKT